MPPFQCFFFFFFNDTATTEIYTLSLHDALPISPCPGAGRSRRRGSRSRRARASSSARTAAPFAAGRPSGKVRSEEHTSELQSPCNLVCRLLLEKKKQIRVLYCNRDTVRLSAL